LEALANGLEDDRMDVGLYAEGEEAEESRGVVGRRCKRSVAAQSEITGGVGIDLEKPKEMRGETKKREKWDAPRTG
jgi:hypothetical protein